MTIHPFPTRNVIPLPTRERVLVTGDLNGCRVWLDGKVHGYFATISNAARAATKLREDLARRSTSTERHVNP